MGYWFSRYDIKYLPRTIIKLQALADFVVDFTLALEKITDDEAAQINHVSNDAWILFVDGSFDFHGVGLGRPRTTNCWKRVSKKMCRLSHSLKAIGC